MVSDVCAVEVVHRVRPKPTGKMLGASLTDRLT